VDTHVWDVGTAGRSAGSRTAVDNGAVGREHRVESSPHVAAHLTSVEDLGGMTCMDGRPHRFPRYTRRASPHDIL